MGQCVETLKTTRVDRAQGFGITEAADIFVAIVLDKWKLLDKASQLLRQAYINECTEEDYMALNLIQELKGYMSGAQRIEGFNKQEIHEILDFICTE